MVVIPLQICQMAMIPLVAVLRFPHHQVMARCHSDISQEVLLVFLYQSVGLGITQFLGFLKILDSFCFLTLQTLSES